MSEKGIVTTISSKFEELSQQDSSQRERERLLDRCTSQTFQESLKKWQQHDAEYNAHHGLQHAPSQHQPSFKIRRGHGGHSTHHIPNTRPVNLNPPTKDDSLSRDSSPHVRQLSTGEETTSRLARGSGSHGHVEEELRALRELLQKYKMENDDLLRENAMLRQEVKDLKATKSFFNSSNSSPAKAVPVVDGPHASDLNGKSEHAGKEGDHSTATHGQSTTGKDYLNPTGWFNTNAADLKGSAGETGKAPEDLHSTHSYERSPRDDGKISQHSNASSEHQRERRKDLPREHSQRSDRERDKKKDRTSSSRRGGDKHGSAKSSNAGGDGAKRRESRHHNSSSGGEKRAHVDSKPSKDSRHSLHLPHGTLASLVQSDGKDVDLTSTNSGAVRGKRERPKSQNLTNVPLDPAIQRGACGTLDCTCPVYVHSDTDVCLRCAHVVTSHAVPQDKELPPDATTNPVESTNTTTAQTTPIATNTNNTDEATHKQPDNTTTASTLSNTNPSTSGALLTASSSVLSPAKSGSVKKVTITDDKDSNKSVVEEANFLGVGDDLALKWVIPYNELTFVEKLGKGISSVVYTGKWRGKEVAIKVLRLETKYINDCKGELAIMSQIHSPYVVHFYGATLDTKLCVVMEICQNGSLFHCLQNEKVQVFWKRALKWSMEIVCGMNILHDWNPIILHRDMKSLNLLVDGEWNLKLCDFGLSRFNTEASQQATLAKLRGTYTYTAPEMYFKNKFTTKSDVFSIGIIFWEIAMRLIGGKYVRPYSEYKDINMDYQIIYRVATKGLRPTMPAGCPDRYQQMIMRCLDNSPENRPSCRELMDIINSINKEFKKKKQKWKKTEFVDKTVKEKK